MNTEQEFPVSEGVEPVEGNETQVVEQSEERQVPLSALEAERKKRQEIEAENRLYRSYLEQSKQQQQPQEDDDDDLITKKEYRQKTSKEINEAKRDILEEAFIQSNPEAYAKVNDYLPELIKQKPWVKDSIENAPNRWQRAWELVKDLYIPQQEQSKKKSETAEKIIQNSNKPGSPSIAGKSRTASTVEYMRSIRGTPAWAEYRAKIRRGEITL